MNQHCNSRQQIKQHKPTTKGTQTHTTHTHKIKQKKNHKGDGIHTAASHTHPRTTRPHDTCDSREVLQAFAGAFEAEAGERRKAKERKVVAGAGFWGDGSQRRKWPLNTQKQQRHEKNGGFQSPISAPTAVWNEPFCDSQKKPKVGGCMGVIPFLVP